MRQNNIYPGMKHFEYQLPENCFFNGEYIMDAVDDEEVLDFIIFSEAWHAKYPDDIIYQLPFGYSQDVQIERKNGQFLFIEMKMRHSYPYKGTFMRRRKSDCSFGTIEIYKRMRSDTRVLFANIWENGVITLGDVADRSELRLSFSKEYENEISRKNVASGKWKRSSDGNVYTAEANYILPYKMEINVPADVWRKRFFIKKEIQDIMMKNNNEYERVNTLFMKENSDENRKMCSFKP